MKVYTVAIDGKKYEVLGCPFCGKEPVVIDVGIDNLWDISCVKGKEPNKHHAFTGMIEGLNKTIKRWNKRAS